MSKALLSFLTAKPIRYTLIIAIAFITQASVLWSAQPPSGYTGAGPAGLGGGPTCVDCHSSFALNSGGGSVSLVGFPGYYIAGQTYNISVKITHGANDRRRWGFAMKAVNSNGQQVGTFGTTNPNIIVSGDEITHNSAPVTSLSGSYTFANITWTAPASPTAADQTVTFYFSGNAANNSLDNTGDYIYNSNQTITLAVTGINDPQEDASRLKILSNPVREQLNIMYTVRSAEQLQFSIIDLEGREIYRINKGKMPAGTYQSSFDLSKFSNGLYFLKMQAGDQIFSRKLFIH